MLRAHSQIWYNFIKLKTLKMMKNKGNKAMKVCQLMEYKIRNIFLEKL